MNANQIINDIANHVGDSPYSLWYVGVAEDAEKRLFTEHKVSKTQGRWIYRPSDSDSVARKAEDYFIHKGMNGGAGGGSNQSKYTYAYFITSYTIQ